METKSFKTDNNLIYHLIDFQKTDIKSAISELVQNSFDAEAKECSIFFDKGRIIIEDNGKGFSNEKEIENYFGTFGTSHQEDNTKKFGRFRIGRSQIFSLGASTWYSNNFILKVDIKNNGLSYNIKNTEDNYKGCKIIVDLYNRKDYYQEQGSYLKSGLENKFKYLTGMNLFFNQVQINKAIKENIAYENDNFIFIESNSNYSNAIAIYNLGIYTKSIFQFPKLKGSLITKKHLKLNIARDEILPDELWGECLEFLSELSQQKKDNKNIDINTIWELIFKKEIDYRQVKDIPIFREIQKGKKYSFAKLEQEEREFGFCFYSREQEKNKIYFDKLKQSGKVLVFEAETFLNPFLKANGISSTILEEIESALTEYLIENSKEHMADRLTDFSGYIINNLSDRILSEQELCKEEKIILKALNQANNQLLPNYRRKIVLGESDEANGWTDGFSFIAVNRRLLTNFNRSKENLFRIGMIIVHEYTHKKGITNTHEIDFYKDFHNFLIEKHQEEKMFVNISPKSWGFYHFYEFFFEAYYKELKKNNLKIPVFLSKMFENKYIKIEVERENERIKEELRELKMKMGEYEKEQKEVVNAYNKNEFFKKIIRKTSFLTHSLINESTPLNNNILYLLQTILIEWSEIGTDLTLSFKEMKDKRELLRYYDSMHAELFEKIADFKINDIIELMGALSLPYNKNKDNIVFQTIEELNKAKK